MLDALRSGTKAAAVWGVALGALLLVPQGAVHAQGGGSFGPPAVTTTVLDAPYDTGVTIKASVPADAGYHDIQISDRRRLHVDMFVKVDGEEMWITALSGDPANLTVPDVMTVNRAQNGTIVASHNVAAKVNAKVAMVNVMVNNLTTSLADCDDDEESYTGVTLAEDMDEAQDNVLISDKTPLSIGMHIRIHAEEMTITNLINNTPNPDRMYVLRAQYGTTAASHDLGADIYAKSNSPTPRQQCGLGAYRIDLQYDQSKARYISLVNESFLTSTGRSIYDPGTCFTPDASIPGLVTMECNTLGSSLGPLGSGLLATALFEPLTIGRPITTLTTSDSFLTDVLGNVLSGVTATSGELRSMTCPDANGDGYASILDPFSIARNFNDRGESSGATTAEPVNASQTIIQISGDQVDVIDGKVDVDESGGSVFTTDDLANVVLDLAGGGTDQVDIIDGKVDVDESGGSVFTTDDLANVVLDLAGGGTDQVDIIDGQVDVNESGAVDAADDLSDVVLLAVPLTSTVAVDSEQMYVSSLSPGPPATMGVVRGFNQTTARTHQTGTAIYVASLDGNGDGIKGYTAARDTNPRVFEVTGRLDFIVNILDAMVAAMVQVQCS
jgi:hypothetical protein